MNRLQPFFILGRYKGGFLCHIYTRPDRYVLIMRLPQIVHLGYLASIVRNNSNEKDRSASLFIRIRLSGN